jgi:hypothetical protein
MERASLDVLNVRASGIEEVRLWSLAGAKGVILLTTPLLGSGEERERERERERVCVSVVCRGSLRPLFHLLNIIKILSSHACSRKKKHDVQLKYKTTSAK